MSENGNKYRVVELNGGAFNLVDPKGEGCGRFIDRELAQKTMDFMNHTGPMVANACGEGFQDYARKYMDPLTEAGLPPVKRHWERPRPQPRQRAAAGSLIA